MTITFSQSDLERIIAAEVRRLFPGATEVGAVRFDCRSNVNIADVAATLDATIQPPASS